MTSDADLELSIRPSRPDEFEAVGDVTVEAYRAHDMANENYVPALRDAAARARDAELLVAVDERGDVIGTVTFCPAGSLWREIAHDDEAEFRMLAVSPVAEGRGVGRALVAACLDRARALGLRGIVLSTPTGNERAHRMYEQLGFTRDPDRDWSPLPDVQLIAYSLVLR